MKVSFEFLLDFVYLSCSQELHIFLFFVPLYFKCISDLYFCNQIISFFEIFLPLGW